MNYETDEEEDDLPQPAQAPVKMQGFEDYAAEAAEAEYNPPYVVQSPIKQRPNNLLLDIPPAVSTSILTEWTKIRTLARVDSACCAKYPREAFLALVSSKDFIVDDMDSQPKTDQNTIAYIKWHMKRKIKASQLRLTGKVITLKHSFLPAFFAFVAGPHVKMVELKEFHDDTSVLMGLIGSTCRNLRKFFIRNSRNCTGIEGVLRCCSETLRSVCIVKSLIGLDPDLSGIVMPNLRTLQLDGKYEIPFTRGMVKASPYLDALYLTRTRADDSVLEAAEGCAATLVELSVDEFDAVGVFLSDAAMISLAKKCVNLRKLRVVCCARLTNETVEAFTSQCTHLEAVMLVGTFNEACLTSLANNVGPRLRHLHLNSLRPGGESGLMAMAQRCPNIESLECISIANGAFQDLPALINAQSRLSQIGLGRSVVTDAVLQAVANRGALIKFLNLYDTTGYTHAGLKQIVRKCTKLRQLAIEETHSMINPTTRELWLMVVPGLEFLHRTFCVSHWGYATDVQ